jgi:hypothetical protein
MGLKYNVWLNGCIVATYQQKKRAFEKADELAKKCNPYNDVLYVTDPWGYKHRYV